MSIEIILVNFRVGLYCKTVHVFEITRLDSPTDGLFAADSQSAGGSLKEYLSYLGEWWMQAEGLEVKFYFL